MTAATEPFASNAEYLEAETQWLKVRAHRMQAEDEIRRLDEQVVSWPPRRGELGATELQAKLEALREIEDNNRADIDARLHAGVRAGTLLGLDRLQHEHKLDAFERLVLLLAAMPALDREVSDAFEGLDRVGWSHQTTVDVSFAVAGCDFQQRLEKRASFKPDAPLIRHGLIKWDSCSQPDGPEILSSSFAISAQAFAVLVGEDS
jgi:hypothetical protein